MTYPARVNLKFTQGDAVSYVIRWGGPPFVYKAITAISKAGGQPSLTVTSHGMVDGWPIIIADVLGMRQINATRPAEGEDYGPDDYVIATKVDANTITINTIDAGSFTAYTSGGFIRYSTPTDLSGYTAWLQVRNSTDGAVLLDLKSADAEITLNNTTKTITLGFTAVHLEDVINGVYDLKLINSDSEPLTICKGSFVVSPTVTYV